MRSTRSGITISVTTSIAHFHARWPQATIAYFDDMNRRSEKIAEGHLNLALPGGVEFESNPAREAVKRVFVQSGAMDNLSPAETRM